MYPGIMNGGNPVAYETKVILAMLAERISNATSIEEAYEVIRNAANVEGVQLPAYRDVIRQREEKAAAK